MNENGLCCCGRATADVGGYMAEVRAACASGTMPSPERVTAIARAHRVQIGQGGDGTWAGWPACPYCHANGGGGHGGLCPTGLMPLLPAMAVISIRTDEKSGSFTVPGSGPAGGDNPVDGYASPPEGRHHRDGAGREWVTDADGREWIEGAGRWYPSFPETMP